MARQETLKISIGLVLGLAFFVYSSSVEAQNDPAKISNEIALSIKAKEPRWKVNTLFKERLEWKDSYHIAQEWSHGSNQAVLSILMLDSAEHAEARFRQAGCYSKKGITKLDNLGDEAYLCPTNPVTKSNTLRFRKANVFVTVRGSSVEIAKRFASYLVDEIPAP